MSGVADPPATLPAELAGLLAGIQRLVRRRLRRGLDEPRLRGAQVELLRLVAASPGLSVSAAAKQLYLADNSVSTLVNQLVGTGLLVRESDPADRRAARLRITPEAAARLREWEGRRTVLIGERLAALTDEERDALTAALPALRRLAAGLQQEEADRG